MLICRTCGGRCVVDTSEHAVVSNGDLWYHIACESCGERKGLLANVETQQVSYTDLQIQEALWKELHPQKPSSC